MTLDVLVEEPRWTSIDLETIAERTAQAVLAYFALDAETCEGSVLACGDAKIAELNTEFCAKEKATNVLSWPAAERATPGQRPPLPKAGFMGEIELGDIAISYDTCLREAEDADKPMVHHVTHLLVHGMLHLLGYDHISDEDAEIMEQTEVEILETLGIPDPY